VYAIFSLVASLPFLIPLTDLGMGAAVTNAAASLPRGYQLFRATLRRTRLILWLVAIAVVTTSLGLGFFGLWPDLVGLPDTSQINWGTACAIALFGVAIPGSLGARILLGIRRNAIVVFVQGLTSLITLAAVGALTIADGSIGAVLPASIAGLLATNWICSIVAFRSRTVLSPSSPLAQEKEEGLKPQIWATALPMLVISFALPLSFQTNRLVLSWVTDLDELAIYSAAAMLYLPIVSVVQVAGRSLWGDFAVARAREQTVTRLYRSALAVSSTLGLVGAVGLVIFGPMLANWATDGQIATPAPLFAAFGSIVVIQALQAPSGMYLTNALGLRFQAVTTSVTALASVPLSIYLARELGAVGPVLATSVCMLFLHVVPCAIFAGRLMRRTDKNIAVAVTRHK
jgi:O-antigen/teichoic acid export membrane protein